MPKINQEEYEVLKKIRKNGFEEIRRNSTGDIAVRGIGEKVTSHQYLAEHNDKFKFMEATGDYWSIAELIEEYEYSTEHVSHVVNERVRMLGKAWSESEETEVKKDIEWLKRSIDKRIKTIESDDITFVGSEYYDEGYIDGMRDVLYRIGQLDEPEVLSQEWIDEHEIHYNHWVGAVPVTVLQNLLVPKREIIEGQAYDKIAEISPVTANEIESVLEKYYSSMLIEFSEEMHESIMRAFDVEETSKTIETLTGMTLEQIAEEARNGGIVPKQELPVIPKFVAEWIEEVKPDNSLRVAFEYIAQRKRDNHDDELAFWVEEGNSETFARAWLDGYEVEKEQKYYVKDEKGNRLLRKVIKGFGIDDRKGKIVSSTKAGEASDFRLTEQEIKDYDPRYWAFAKPVEELEE